jgi:hypothetical protein
MMLGIPMILKAIWGRPVRDGRILIADVRCNVLIFRAAPARW